jgi:hypothetical protein
MKTLNTTIDQRLNTLYSPFELTLLIGDKDTTLRIWVDKKDNVFMRLDKYQAYSAPLSEDSYKYLTDENGIIKQLLQFGFKSQIANIPAILKITESLKQVTPEAW